MLTGTFDHVAPCHSEVAPLLSSSFTNHNPPVMSVDCNVHGSSRLYGYLWKIHVPLMSGYGHFLCNWLLYTCFCLVLDFMQCSPTLIVLLIKSHPSTLAVFHMESSFLCQSRQWAVITLTFMPTSILIEANTIACTNLHAHTAHFLVGTAILKFITPPFLFLMWIKDSSPCITFQPCL